MCAESAKLLKDWVNRDKNRAGWL